MSLDIELNTYDMILKSLFGKTVKRLKGNTSVNVGDIVSYVNGSDIEFYKIIKKGAISKPSTTYCKRVLLADDSNDAPAQSVPTASAGTAGIITENRVKQLAHSLDPTVPDEASLDEIWKGVCNG